MTSLATPKQTTQGVLAHGAANAALTTIHVVLSALFSTCIATFSTAWFFILRVQCSVVQASYSGCDVNTCPCLASNTCSATDLATEGCAACTAPRAEVCRALDRQHTFYILAFGGIVMLVSAIPAVCLDIVVLTATSARRNSTTARLQAIRVGVDQQTRLISAGDKPTVTPGTLTDWVSLLLVQRTEKDFLSSAERCRAALRGRGYELPIKLGKKGTKLTSAGKTAANPLSMQTPPAAVALSATALSVSQGGKASPRTNGVREHTSYTFIDSAERGVFGASGTGSGNEKKKAKLSAVTPENSSGDLG